MVEIWPPIVAQKTEPPQEWVTPLDMPRESDPPPVELARRIAARIKAMTDERSSERISGARIGATRPITPGDVMILVRRRGAFFEAMVRAEGTMFRSPAPIVSNIASISRSWTCWRRRAALLPEDDLSLACVLKSPLAN